MNFLKGLALGLLSFLLFLSLSIFGLALTINCTALSPDFVVSELNKLDVSALAEELLNPQIAPLAQQYGEEFVFGVLRDTITEVEPWMKEEASDAIYNGYDYFLGRSQSLSVVISTEPIKDSLKNNLREAFLTSPPPELSGMPPAVIGQAFDETYRQISEDIPPALELTESSLTPDVMDTLERVRQYIGYFRVGYSALIGFMVALIVGIVFLMNRRIKSITRELGIIFVTYGAFEYAGILITKHLVLPRIPLGDIPPSLQAWIDQLWIDIVSPLEIFSLCLLIGGAALLIVSFVYKSRQQQSEL